MHININAQKFQGISNLNISADLHGRLAPEEPFSWKNQFPCSQKHSLKTLKDLITCLHLKMFVNFKSERPSQSPKYNS